jgi:peptide subunit release factor 1 (eRF1)
MVRLDSPVRLIQRSLAASSTPLLLAGDEATLKKLVDWLPQRAISRLLGTLAVPPGFDQREAVDLMRDRLAAIHAEESLQLVSRVVAAIRTHGPAVAGHVATLEALRQGSVDTLVIADAGQPKSGAHWDAKIELSRQACRQGTRVVLADSEELRYLGGVGCLLRQRREAAAMPVPTRFGQLDLVA